MKHKQPDTCPGCGETLASDVTGVWHLEECEAAIQHRRESQASVRRMVARIQPPQEKPMTFWRAALICTGVLFVAYVFLIGLDTLLFG